MRLKILILTAFVCNTLYISGVTDNTEDLSPAVITHQPEGASICAGSDYTIPFTATGSGLTYQWYLDDQPISGATDPLYTIRKATKNNDYGYYKVVVQGSIGPAVTSEIARIWVADSIAKPILFDLPSVAYTDQYVRLHIGSNNGYPDVSKYTWSFGEPNSDLSVSGPGLYTLNVRFHKATPQQFIAVVLDHICDSYVVFKSLRVDYPADIDQTSVPRINIYPNPAQEQLNVAGEGLMIMSIVVTDVNGRIIYREAPRKTGYSLSISNWPAGIYFVEVATDAGTSLHKIIKN